MPVWNNELFVFKLAGLPVNLKSIIYKLDNLEK
jgi:hypothetical protein